MKRESKRRLLGLARDCQLKGWAAMAAADAALALCQENPRRADRGAEIEAARLAGEARGFFRDAVKLLDEVIEDGADRLDTSVDTSTI